MPIINGTFNTDLSGWTPSGNGTYDVIQISGRARLRVYQCSNAYIQQTFTIDSNTIRFDWQTAADDYYELPGCKLIIGGTTVINEGLPLGQATGYSGTKTIDTSAYIGQTATIQFYIIQSEYCPSGDHANTYLYIDNIQLFHTPTTGSLKIISTPSGAGIWLALHNQTPLWQNIYTPDPVTNLSPGFYDIRLTKNGYEDWLFANAEIIADTETQISAGMVLLPTPANITATNITASPNESPCRVGTCTVTVDVTWTNTGGTSGSFTPSIKINNVPVIVDPPLTPVSVGPSGTKSQQFIITGLTAGDYTICPDPN